MLFAAERSYDDIISAATAGYPVPAELVRAVIAQESRFNPNAVRPEPRIQDASRGLMQVLVQTARGLGFVGQPSDLFDPGVNIVYGVRYLWQQYQRTGSWQAAVSAYNGGYRPSLAFGAVATVPMRVCLAYDDNGTCRTERNVAVGEYANQPYVDAVFGYYNYFLTGTTPPNGGAGKWALAAIIGAALLA